MRGSLLCGVGAGSGARPVPARSTGAAETRRHRQDDHDRRHVPAHGPRVGLRADSGRDEGVLLVHQCAPWNRRQARRGRSPDRLQVLRRRLQPGEHRAADTRSSSSRTRSSRSSASSARRCNLAVRRYLNSAKVPQMLRLDGCDDWGPKASSTPGRSAGSPTTSPRDVSTAQNIARFQSEQKIAVLYQNDDYGKDYLTRRSRRGSAADAARTSSPRSRSRSRRRASRRRSRS